jgi:16S rRNA (cytosine967-C5)-methyltransferase
VSADPARAQALARLLETPLGAIERDSGPAGPAESRARELFLGVRRHLLTIDTVLERYVAKGVARVERRLLEALRLGAFQLLYESDVPAPLVVASTVTLAGASAKKKGFLNAVLRKMAGEREIEPDAPVPARARDRVIVGRRAVARFPAPVLPDYDADLVAYLAAQFSQTTWLVEALMRDLPDEIDELLLALMLPLPLAVRVNTLRADADAVEMALKAEGATVLRRFGNVIEMRFAGSIADCPSFRAGLATVQDVVASEVAPFLGALPGERILDLCAGSGGKSTHLAEISGGKAEIVAADVSARQLAKLAENVARLGTPGITPLELRPTTLASLPPFDRVLVDAPCSNSGVLMKRVAARWRLDRATVLVLARKEIDLLERGAACVKPGGVLVYSTCSILPQENSAVVERFLARNGSAFGLEDSRLAYPHRTGRDGGYMARLRRSTGGTENTVVAGTTETRSLTEPH